MDLFEMFENGQLVLPSAQADFGKIPWTPHAEFEGVELKHLIKADETDGAFSYHLVRVAPGKKIGLHKHETQLETHEVIRGTGICSTEGKQLQYALGTISILPAGVPHEVAADNEGLYLFAKFMPALY